MGKKRRRRKGQQYNWYDTSKVKRGRLEELCPVNEWRVIKPQQLLGIVPVSPELLDKSDSVFVMSSGSYDGTAYYMANLNRVDRKAGEIDQQPLGLVFSAKDTSMPSGCIIQHGDWDERSIEPPAQFWEYYNDCKVGDYFPLRTLPAKSFGSIFELKNDNIQGKAFQALLDELKKTVEGDERE